MCSGCSGPFEDGEDREPGEGELAEGEAGAWGWSVRERSRSWEEGPDATLRPARNADDYEVLVSAEQIVERRVVRAKCCVVSGEETPEAIRQCDESWDGSLRERQRSRVASARDYRTFAVLDGGADNRNEGVRNLLIQICLAAVPVAALALWLAAR
jgi:hypothetical protein